MFGYGNPQELRLLPIQEKTFHQDRYFPKSNEQQIKWMVFSSEPINIQKLLRYIHSKYGDQGLRTTLIHRLFDNKTSEIAYYVPQLVYIAIKKESKHMKKVLLYHAKGNQSLKRLILWNLKAFTVMMKQKSEEIKSSVEEFEAKLVEQQKDPALFSQSLQAISMLTEASLTLKKIPKQKMKEKLQKFTKKFNLKYLCNTDHNILIPFRQQVQQKYQSDYVARIIQDECSCFPTRKRVPYRIIIETIDARQLQKKHPDQKLFHHQKVEPDEDKDLFNQVNEAVLKIFRNSFLNIPTDNQKLFAKDNEESKKFSDMKTYYKSIQKKQEQEKQQNIQRSRLSNRHSAGFGLPELYHHISELQRYRIEPSENLKKFEAIYIPDLRSNQRVSDAPDISNKKSYIIQHCLDDSRKRKSDMYVQQQAKNVKIYQEDTKQNDYISETFFGKPWEQKKLIYKKQSYFRKFDSLRFRNVVVKGGDDLRQQIICMQLIYKMKEILNDAKTQVFIKPYQIIVLSQNSGLLEFVSNSVSIDQMKKMREQDNTSIDDFFRHVFNNPDKLQKAQLKFVHSLVGSSIMTYVLKLKDRHNGNILLDMDGNIIHIDFGFILGMAPGNINFQKSPFKFTTEYLQFLGGKGSRLYNMFVDQFHQGMRVLRDRAQELSLVLEIMMEDSDLECFKNFDLGAFMNQFKQHYSEQKFKEYCLDLVQESCENRYSVYYDNFQQFSNGIYP